MSNKILSLDISSSAVGGCYSNGTTKNAGVYLHNKKLEHHERITLFCKGLREFKATNHIDIVGIEMPYERKTFFNGRMVHNSQLTITLSLYVGSAIGALGVEQTLLIAPAQGRALVFSRFTDLTRAQEKQMSINRVNELYPNIAGEWLVYDPAGKNTHDDIADSININDAIPILLEREKLLAHYITLRNDVSSSIKRRDFIEEKLKEYKSIFGIRLIEEFKNVINDDSINSKHEHYTKKQNMRKYFVELEELQTKIDSNREEAKKMLEEHKGIAGQDKSK